MQNKTNNGGNAIKKMNANDITFGSVLIIFFGVVNRYSK